MWRRRGSKFCTAGCWWSKNKIKKTAKSDIQFIIAALSNIKSAANHVLNNKIDKGLINQTNRQFNEMGYSEIFNRKIITPLDFKFYVTMSTNEGIFGRIQESILNEPLWEWLPRSILSPEQIRVHDIKMVKATEEAVLIRNICQNSLVRRK